MKGHTPVQRMGKVLRHIEEHLDEELGIAALAQIACYSQFHFHRLFRAYIGESIHAYRKRLLLERAARQLRYGNEGIGEIAFRCGYDTQSSFNKAFKALFGLAPGQMRNPEFFHLYASKVEHAPKGTFVKRELKCEFRTIDEIRLVCRRETGRYAEASPKAWGSLMGFAYSRRLMTNEVRMIGIVHDDPSITDPERIRYDACIDVDVDIRREEGLSKQSLSAGEYAVFLHQGPYQELSHTYAAIYHDWLPESGCTLRDVPGFEVYLNRDPRKTKPENLRTEIHIPVIGNPGNRS